MGKQLLESPTATGNTKVYSLEELDEQSTHGLTSTVDPRPRLVPPTLSKGVIRNPTGFESLVHYLGPTFLQSEIGDAEVNFPMAVFLIK